MYSFLPHEYTASLHKEYIIRLLVVFFCTLTVVIVIGDIVLLPSLVLSRAELTASEVRIAQANKSSEAHAAKQASEDVRKANNLLTNISTQRVSVVDLTLRAVTRKNEGILLKEFSTSYQDTTYTITVTGQALTREALVSYKKALELDPSITKVELPVSDLAKSKNISFSIKITGNLKNDSHE